MAFRWPSVTYAVEFLRRDVSFPLAMVFAAPVFGGSRLNPWIRWMTILSGLLAFAGPAGVALDDFRWRSVGSSATCPSSSSW